MNRAMRRIYTLVLLLFCGIHAAFAASDGLAEAVYISTDKETYVAGDLIFCSAFCVNPLEDCRLSSASSVAYLELVSSEGTAAQAKIALIGGRGSGVISLPLNISTGNYRLYAYTSLGREETEPQMSYKTLSIFNTLSGERVPSGVEVLGRSEYVEKQPDGEALVQDGPVKLFSRRDASISSTVPLSIENTAGEEVTMSVSVTCVDGIISPENGSISSFVASAPALARPSEVVPDFEGERIRAHFIGPDAESVAGSHVYIPVISSPGASEDFYAGHSDSEGRIEFSTGNIYGKKDLFCEILRLGNGMDCRFILDSPFVGPDAGDIPQLEISTAMYEDLSRRSEAMQLARSAELDTLYEYLPKRESLLLSDLQYTQYHLDDYTRFPTIKDIFVEIIPTVRIRRGSSGKREVQVLLQDLPGNLERFSDDVLVMLDGVPVSDHEKLLTFDAMLLSDVFVYPYTYIVGNYSFKGVVNLVTFTHNISSLRFDDNLVIVDFQGASYPVAFTGSKGVGASASESKEDLRGTLYWHPQLSVSAGQTMNIEVHTPSYSGTFKAVAEGLTSSGKPFTYETTFEVR